MKSDDSRMLIPTPVRFIFSTISACGATFFTHPFDVVKLHQQVSKNNQNLFKASTQLVSKNGKSALYKGFSASLMRQVSYGSVRLGLFSSLCDFYTINGVPPTFIQKLSFSIIAGGVGAFVGNPFDLSLVRIGTDSSLPTNERRNYTGVFNAISRIIREEGITALWIGAKPTISRCIVLNMAQLTTYAQTKELLLKQSYFTDNIYCHLTSSFISGFIATVVSAPFDIVKTRLQQDTQNQYKTITDCIIKIIRNERFFNLWKGFTPAYLRLAPQTTLIFIAMEQLNQFYLRTFQ